MKELPQYLWTVFMSCYKQFDTLKEFEICDCFLLISKQPFMLRIF